jgi:hypothetical protein
MSDPSTLRPADPANLVEALFFALRYDGRKRVHHADSIMARIVAERLVQHLERAGYVVMRKPGGGAPATSGMPTPGVPAR